MIRKVSRKGRPPGASLYARQDEQALERMYELVREGQPVATAALTVTIEMKLEGTHPEERLRKKFTRRRAEVEARIAARSRPQEPQPTRLAPIGEPARQTAALLKTPEGKALVRSAREHVRWAAENKDLLRTAVAHVRSPRKP